MNATVTCSVGPITPEHAKALHAILTALAEAPNVVLTCDQCKHPVTVRTVNGSGLFFQHFPGSPCTAGEPVEDDG